MDPLAQLAVTSGERLHILVDLIEDNGLEEQSMGDSYLNRRGADLLAHLHGWHLLFEDWLREEASGGKVQTPAPGHTWEDLRLLNDDLYERYNSFSYGEIKGLVLESHARMFDLLRVLPLDGLLDPTAHPWSPEPLLVLADECSGRHYDWAIGRVTEALGKVGKGTGGSQV